MEKPAACVWPPPPKDAAIAPTLRSARGFGRLVLHQRQRVVIEAEAAADARIAWGLTTLESALDKQFMTWAGGVRPCAHYAFLFGCGLLQVSGMRGLAEDDRWQTRFGGGLHAGIDVLLRAPFHLQLWGEGVVLSNGYSVVRDGTGFWHGLPVLGGFGATAFLTW